MNTKLSGNSCPLPGSVPHGNWTCKMQETQISGTSFLDDEEVQSYMGKFGFKNTTYVATIWTSHIPIGMWDVQIVAGDFPQLKLIKM